MTYAPALTSPSCHRWVALVLASGLGLALGCGSSSGATGGGSGCDAFFEALYYSSCGGGPKYPASEVSRVESLFGEVCKNEEALPGSGITDDFLGACAAALSSAGCGASNQDIPACELTGARAAGAACNDGSQCTSGLCTFDLSTNLSCGACSKSVPAGAACNSADVACAMGTACDTTAGSPVCKTISYGASGAACNGVAERCNSDLVCNVGGKCAVPGGLGSACMAATECEATLTCMGGPTGTCRAFAAAGEACEGDQECAAGLGCSQTTGKCGSVTWVSAGMACGDLALCLVGNCASGKCPKVIPDGQACPTTTSETCDTLSSCVSGTCGLEGDTVCK
jgi:hypothetical protein